MSCKKEERLQSKKRKLEVLLRLFEKDEPAEKKFKEIDAEVNKSLEVIDQKVLTSEELSNLRAKLKERQKTAMQLSKIFLTLDDLLATPEHDLEEIDQKAAVIYPMDVQHLLLYALQGNVASCKPRWCRLIRQPKVSHVVVVVIEAVSCVDFATYPESFQFLVDNFPMKVQMISPSQYGKSFGEELFHVPMSARQLMFMNTQAKDNESDIGAMKYFRIASSGPDAAKTNKADVSTASSSDRVISCLDLLLHEEQMKLESYPMPLMNSTQLARYKFSKACYTLPNDFSPLFAIDCEMVRTKTKKSELAWVAVVNEKLECVYQSLVKPRDTVVDYLTQFSGVSESLLRNVTTTLKDVQMKLRSLLPSDAILVGQSLNADLHALEIFHPYVIDTSVVYNLTGTPSMKTGLKRLTSAFLGRDIQSSENGHNPCEDALATMELVLQKLKHGFEFGNVLNGWTWNLKTDPSPSGDKTDDNKSTIKAVVSEDLNGSNDVVDSKHMDSDASDDTLAQRKFFFRHSSNSQSLFDLAKRSDRSVAVVGFGKDMVGDAEILDGELSESDKTVAKQTFMAIENHFLVCSRFQGVAKELLHSDQCSRCIQRSFQGVTKQLKRVVKHSPPNTLVAVVLTGKSDSKQTENGICFVKITEQLPVK